MKKNSNREYDKFCFQALYYGYIAPETSLGLLYLFQHLLIHNFIYSTVVLLKIIVTFSLLSYFVMCALLFTTDKMIH